VGFQTGLKWGEQDRVFRIIPGLAVAEFLRYGVMHRNAFLDSPRLTDPYLRLRDRPSVFVAGQLSGVEGYVESTMCGLYCGMNAARVALGLEPITFPRETLCGSLIHYVTTPESPDFQPMNANFGLLPALEAGPRNKKERRGVVAERALAAMERFVEQHGDQRLA
jgi:methylenetetrahydrofolate--tRNA-(uracil-5-)-methyltransferase